MRRQKQTLVIAVSSRALFDLEVENKIFKKRGLRAYRDYQRRHEQDLLNPGAAFKLVSKLLRVNDSLGENAVEVVIVSRNDADTSIRIFKAVEHYRLPISRAAFTNGAPNYAYLNAFGASLYLSAHLEDVRTVISKGCAAAHVMGIPTEEKLKLDNQLRIGFDFDGVLASDESEQVFQKGQLKAFLKYEEKRQGTPLTPGPILRFLKLLGALRERAESRGRENIRTALFTARNSPAHKRVVATLRKNGLIIDETCFLGGLKKAPFVEAFHPDIFFDDQLRHLANVKNVVTAFVPYGLVNSLK